MSPEPYTWEPGMILAMWQDGPGHRVWDTGFQLLTGCGRRVTYMGAAPDPLWWYRVPKIGCFECQPSPMIEWTEQ
jgi:hypothetical protein